MLIALVPELKVHYIKNTNIHYRTQWFKRLWTFGEAILSEKMLFVGTTHHIWTEDMVCPQTELGSYLFSQSPRFFQVNDILFYAHIRTSTKDHDQVYALANIYPDMMKKLIIDYSQPFNDLLIKFYGLLAQKSISILLFTGHEEYKRIGRKKDKDDSGGSNYEVSIQKFDLPSWTGVNGEHLLSWYGDYTPDSYSIRGFRCSFENYSISGRTMEVACAAVTRSSGTANDVSSTVEKLKNLTCSSDYFENLKVINNIREEYHLHVPVR